MGAGDNLLLIFMFQSASSGVLSFCFKTSWITFAADTTKILPQAYFFYYFFSHFLMSISRLSLSEFSYEVAVLHLPYPNTH